MIESNYFWNNTILLAIGTFLIRSSVIAVSSRVRISGRTKEIFSFIPAAVLPALAVPMVFYHQGTQSWLLGKERFAILLLSIIVAYFSKRMTVTLIFGLVTLYLVTTHGA
jgi:branched-subunit amino acid transport protein